MGLMTDEQYDQIKDYVHPKIHTFVEHLTYLQISLTYGRTLDVMLLIKMEPENLYDTK